MYIVLLLTLLAFAGLAVASRTSRISDFYVAGGNVPAVFSGMAIAASLVPLLVLAGAVGSSSAGRQDGLALMLGGAAGLILAGLVLAPGLRKLGGMTIADFLGERFGGTPVRLMGVIALILCSFPLLAMALRILGSIGTGVFALDLGTGVAVAMVMILLAVFSGGLRSLTRTQVAQYLVLFAATLAAAAILWRQDGGFPESAGLGAILDGGWAFSLQTLEAGEKSGGYALMFCLFAGTASLPHLLMRSFAARSAADARASFLWAFLFAASFGLAAPAVLGVVSGVSGESSPIIAGFLAIGAIAACLALAGGLLAAIANALSYDVHFKTLDRAATSQQRLLVARGLALLIAIVAAYTAVHYPGEVLTVATWSFSLAASGLLPVLILGFWWKRANAEGALAGMAAGLGACVYYLLGPQYFPIPFYEISTVLSNATPDQAAHYLALSKAYYVAEGAAKLQAYADWIAHVRALANWWGVDGAAAGLFGVPVGFAVTIAVSLLKDAPSRDVQNFVAELRRAPR